MNFNDEESERIKAKTSENFNKKILIKKRQFSNGFYDPETMKDFTRFTDIININTFGSQPIIMYKKIKRLQSPIEKEKKIYPKEQKTSATSRDKITKNILKNNYICDGGLPQKINKYKNKLVNHHSQSPSKKIRYNNKTKSNNDKKNINKEKTQRGKNKKKEYIPKTSKGYNFKQIFKKAGIENSNKKVGQKKETKENSKYMTDKNTIEEEEMKKKEFINNLIKNVVTCFKKEFIAKKNKNAQKKKLTEKKIRLENEDSPNQQENGLVIMDKSKDRTNFKIKKIKPKKKIKIEKLNSYNINNNINKPKNLNDIFYNFHTDNEKYILNNITNSNNFTKSNELSKILIKSRIMSNNNYNCENIDSKNLISESKKKIFKPQINQFEFLEKIRDNFKKIKKVQKNLPELNDSFRFTQSGKYKSKNKLPDYIPYNETEEQKIEQNKKSPNDEFLFADRVTHRTHNELKNFLKKKKLEKKKEQNEEIKKKQEKILNTLQNLIKLGEQCKTNNSPHKNRIDSKNHLKSRKVANEYYVGTEESKNNTSTFIDKQEYYKSILESKNVLINSKIEKTETNLEDINLNKNKQNNSKIIISNSMLNYKNNYIHNNYKKTGLNEGYNDKQNNYYKDRFEELKKRGINNIKFSNEIINKENLKRIKSDLSDATNNNVIKAKFENKYFIKNINNNINKNHHLYKNINNIIDIEIKNKILNLQKIYSTLLKKKFLKNLKEKYNKEKSAQIIMKKKIALDYLIGICKIYQFKKIQEYNEKMKCSRSLIKLFTPFIRHKFSLFIHKCKYFNKLKNLMKALTRLFGYIILKKIINFSKNVEFLNKVILPAIKSLQKLFLKKYFEKIKNSNNSINNLNLNVKEINNNKYRSYISEHYEKEENKANSYIYESLDCEDSISVHPNSVDNDGLHQLKEIIEMQNEYRYEDNRIIPKSEASTLQYAEPFELKKLKNDSSENDLDSLILRPEIEEKIEKPKIDENKIKTEMPLKEHILQQIINSNQTSSEEIKNQNSKQEIKEDKKNSGKEYLIITKINDEKENDEKINTANNKDNIIKEKNNNDENIINIIENNNDNMDIDKIHSNLKRFNEIKKKIKDKNKFADDLSEYIISKLLIEKEIKSPDETLFPKKTGIFDFQKIFDFNLNPSIKKENNSDINTLDSLLNLSDYSRNNASILEKSMFLQYSLSSEFNKTIKERKNTLESNLYNNYIIDKFILLICKEIRQNYSRIYDNICIPYKANYEQVIVASYLQDNELLNNSYKELKVKEDLKNIINKKKIIEKFDSMNKKIRRLKGLEENNIYDNFINECIIDATIEIINKERSYGISGEPFPFSKREREICFKYNRNDPKPLMKHVYKSLKIMLFGKGNIIKENSPIFDKNDPFLMNIFKKEMENENIWNELEIQEEQVKSMVSNVIFEQLINEVIEILEHVQLNRKKPELYQNKSIYACDEIPRLSFQMISSNSENDEVEDIVSS